MKKLALGAAGLTVAAVAALAGIILWADLPTDGAKIGAYARPGTAYVVIDLQEDFTGPQALRPYQDAERVIAAANAVLARAREEGATVVYVENVVENGLKRMLMGGVNAPGAPGTRTDRRILQVAGGRTFPKGRGDAFSNPDLEAFLRERQIDHVVLMGLDAAHCVNATAGGALRRGYRVTMVTDAITTTGGKSVAELAEGWRKSGAEVVTTLGR
ncbi:MAG: isochorismatase family cysteine hydrolase [Myxococcales bacterium]